MKASQIADAIGAELVGNAEADIERIRPIDKAGEGDLTFLLDGKEPPAPESVPPSVRSETGGSKSRWMAGLVASGSRMQRSCQ